MNAAPMYAFIPEYKPPDEEERVTHPHARNRPTPPPSPRHLPAAAQAGRHTPTHKKHARPFVSMSGVRLLVSASVGCCGSHGEIF